jgi:putative endonuclease
MPDRQALGREAEARAEHMLLARGLALVQRNYRCRGGEIDLIMRDGGQLVFVEVRYRRSNSHGGALASVDARKRRRLVTAAQHYLMTSRWPGPCRFDVVGLGESSEGQWVRDAFGV